MSGLSWEMFSLGLQSNDSVRAALILISLESKNLTASPTDHESPDKNTREMSSLTALNSKHYMPEHGCISKWHAYMSIGFIQIQVDLDIYFIYNS